MASKANELSFKHALELWKKEKETIAEIDELILDEKAKTHVAETFKPILAIKPVLEELVDSYVASWIEHKDPILTAYNKLTSTSDSYANRYAFWHFFEFVRKNEKFKDFASELVAKTLEESRKNFKTLLDLYNAIGDFHAYKQFLGLTYLSALETLEQKKEFWKEYWNVLHEGTLSGYYCKKFQDQALRYEKKFPEQILDLNSGLKIKLVKSTAVFDKVKEYAAKYLDALAKELENKSSINFIAKVAELIGIKNNGNGNNKNGNGKKPEFGALVLAESNLYKLSSWLENLSQSLALSGKGKDVSDFYKKVRDFYNRVTEDLDKYYYVDATENREEIKKRLIEKLLSLTLLLQQQKS
jgi:hypothetical protein